MSNVDDAINAINVLLSALDLAANFNIEIGKVVALQQQAKAEGREVSDEEIDAMVAEWHSELYKYDTGAERPAEFSTADIDDDSGPLGDGPVD